MLSLFQVIEIHPQTNQTKTKCPYGIPFLVGRSQTSALYRMLTNAVGKNKTGKRGKIKLPIGSETEDITALKQSHGEDDI